MTSSNRYNWITYATQKRNGFKFREKKLLKNPNEIHKALVDSLRKYFITRYLNSFKDINLDIKF